MRRSSWSASTWQVCVDEQRCFQVFRSVQWIVCCPNQAAGSVIKSEAIKELLRNLFLMHHAM